MERGGGANNTQTEEQDAALTSLFINSLLDLLRCVITPVVVVVKHGTHHHGNAVVNGRVLLQQGALEVVPDLCRAGRENTRFSADSYGGSRGVHPKTRLLSKLSTGSPQRSCG